MPDGTMRNEVCRYVLECERYTHKLHVVLIALFPTMGVLKTVCRDVLGVTVTAEF